MPRSRTAWLAAWLTTNSTLCLHDSPANCLPPVENGIRAGLSGPEVCTAYRDFTACWPNAPWLVVHRADARQAFEPILLRHLPDLTQGECDAWFAGRKELLDQVATGRRTLVVSYARLDDLETSQAVWKHLLPELRFDPQRWRLLNSLNIQQDRERKYPPELIRRK